MSSTYGGSVYFSPSAVIAPHESLKNSYMVRSPTVTKEMAREEVETKEVTISMKDQCFHSLGCSWCLSADTKQKHEGMKLKDAIERLNALLQENERGRQRAESDLTIIASNLEESKRVLISINSISMISADNELITSKDKNYNAAKYKILLNKIRSQLEDYKRASRRLNKSCRKEELIKSFMEKVEGAREYNTDYVAVLQKLNKQLSGIDRMKGESIEAIHNATSAMEKLDVIQETNDEIAGNLEAEEDPEQGDNSNPDFTRFLEECKALSIPAA